MELASLAGVVVPDLAQARDVLLVNLIQRRIVSGGFIAEIDGPVVTLGGRGHRHDGRERERAKRKGHNTLISCSCPEFDPERIREREKPRVWRTDLSQHFQERLSVALVAGGARKSCLAGSRLLNYRSGWTSEADRFGKPFAVYLAVYGNALIPATLYYAFAWAILRAEVRKASRMASRCDIFTNRHSGIDHAIGCGGLWAPALLGKCGIFFVLLAQLGAQVTVEMSQYDYERTGANLQEWILHPSNVNSASFGKLFSRSVDASVYALPLIVPNLNIAGERRNVLFVATMGNTVYAFDADDPARAEPYWSKNLGTPAPGDSWIGPVYHGILSTPFIDVPTGTLYTVTMVRKGQESNLFVHALDIHDGTPKYNSPQLLSFPFAGAETLTNVKGGLQRVGLLMRNEVLYIAFANIVPDPKDQHWSQEGFVQSFNARDLSQRLAVFQSTPTGRKGGIWQAGRGIASDGAGNIYIATAGGSYDGITNFGSSVLKFAPRSLKLTDWFTPKNHEYLFLQNIDMSAGGVTLIPNSQLMFAGGKEGVIFLLNREAMGKLEGENAEPLQRFKATNGCGQKDCAQTLGTAFWARKNDGVLYVWDRNDVPERLRFRERALRYNALGRQQGETGNERRADGVGQRLRRRDRNRLGCHYAINEERRARSRDAPGLPCIEHRPGTLQ